MSEEAGAYKIAVGRLTETGLTDVHPVQIPSLIEFEPRFDVGTDVPDQAYHFEPPKFEMKLTFTSTAHLRELTRARVFKGYHERRPTDGIFRLEADGTVSTYMRIRFRNKSLPLPRWWNKTRTNFLQRVWLATRASQDVGPGWFYVSAVDNGVWKWALKNGLQLEDAVRELNRMFRAGEL